MTRDERLTERTIDIINKHGRILLKRSDGWYMQQHTNIAGGYDAASWTSWRSIALEIDNLKWAFTIAPLYKCRVVVVYPKKETIDETLDRAFHKFSKPKNKMGGLRNSRATNRLDDALEKIVKHRNPSIDKALKALETKLGKQRSK